MHAKAKNMKKKGGVKQEKINAALQIKNIPPYVPQNNEQLRS